MPFCGAAGGCAWGGRRGLQRAGIGLLRPADLFASVDASVASGCAACGTEKTSIFLLLAVLTIKLVDELDAAGQVALRLPGVTLKAVASPADQVLSLPLLVFPFAHYPLHLQGCKVLLLSSTNVNGSWN